MLFECGESQAATWIENLSRKAADFHVSYDLTINVPDHVIDDYKPEVFHFSRTPGQTHFTT